MNLRMPIQTHQTVKCSCRTFKLELCIGHFSSCEDYERRNGPLSSARDKEPVRRVVNSASFTISAPITLSNFQVWQPARTELRGLAARSKHSHVNIKDGGLVMCRTLPK
jgi:hypothetical protein